jgi:hypothetical protein
MRRNISITLRRLFSADRMLPPRRNYLSWQPGQVNKSRSVETSFRQWDKKLSSSMKTRLRQLNQTQRKLLDHHRD